MKVSTIFVTKIMHKTSKKDLGLGPGVIAIVDTRVLHEDNETDLILAAIAAEKKALGHLIKVETTIKEEDNDNDHK